MKKIILIIVVVCIAGIAAMWFLGKGKEDQSQDTPSASPTLSPQSISSNFTLRVPDGYRAHSQLNDEEELITIENGEGAGLQIFVTPFDEPGPITEERIREDLPEAEIYEPGLAKLDGEMSFLFYGFDEDLGETFEVWAVHKGKLFQIMSAKVDESLVEKTLDTWKWK